MNDFIPTSSQTLFLDIGNSSIKAAYRKGMNWQNPTSFGLNSAGELIKWVNNHSEAFKQVVMCSVIPKATKAVRSELKIPVKVFKASDIPLDLLDYKTPKTLGMDRFFACYGAITHTNKSVVVIDSGTACTVDYMSADEIYRGGVIMPGIHILEESLKQHTPILPEVERSLPRQWPGKSTKESLQWGISGMVQKSIEGYLREYEANFEDFDVVVTGGGAQWVVSLLKRETKVRRRLVFEGMQRFLEYYS